MEYMKRTGQVIVLKRESYQLWKIAKGRRDFSCTVVSNTNEPAGRHKQHAISKDITDTKGLRLLMMLLGENGCVSINVVFHNFHKYLVYDSRLTFYAYNERRSWNDMQYTCWLGLVGRNRVELFRFCGSWVGYQTPSPASHLLGIIMWGILKANTVRNWLVVGRSWTRCCNNSQVYMRHYL